MSRYEQFTKLEAGKKYTLVGMGEMGFPYQLKFTHLETRLEGYAQYTEGAMVVCKPKGKRHARGYHFYGSKECLVYEGWIEVNTDMYATRTTTASGNVILESRSSFDKEYMEVAKNSTTSKPIIELGPEERKTTGEVYILCGDGHGKRVASREEFICMVEALGYTYQSEHSSRSTREELQGQPIFNNLCGPMYDGEKDGKAVIRYETWELYQKLST